MAMNPIQREGRRRKITVNERVEQILHGAEVMARSETATTCAAREEVLTRKQQLSNLYSTSMEDRFLKTRTKQSTQLSRSVPKPTKYTGLVNARQRTVPPLAFGCLNNKDDDDDDLFTSSRNNTSKHIVASPIKPVRCLAQHLLQERQEQDELNRKTNEPEPSSPGQLRPWYNTNPLGHRAPQCTIDAKIRRYGAYGTAKMLAFETKAGTVPTFPLKQSQSLDSLVYKNVEDTWSPTLHGTPSLWPEDTVCPHGAKGITTAIMTRCPSPTFRFPTHSVAAPTTKDTHFTRTKAIHQQDTNVRLHQALEDEKEQRKQEIQLNKSRLQDWQTKFNFDGLGNHLDHPIRKVNAKCAKELTIMHMPEYSRTSHFHEHMQKLTENKHMLRWRNMAILMDVMRHTPCRRPVLQDIEKLFALAYEVAHKNTNPYALNRDQFWELMHKEYPILEARHANRLFSSYDYRMEDQLDIRVFLGTVRALRVQQGTPIEILCSSLSDFDTTRCKVISSLEHFVASLSLCCGNDAEEQQIHKNAVRLWKILKNGRQRQHFIAIEDNGVEEDVEYVEDEEEARWREEGRVAIKYARYVLKREQQVLSLFTEMLLKRREECFNVTIPPSR